MIPWDGIPINSGCVQIGLEAETKWSESVQSLSLANTDSVSIQARKINAKLLWSDSLQEPNNQYHFHTLHWILTFGVIVLSIMVHLRGRHQAHSMLKGTLSYGYVYLFQKSMFVFLFMPGNSEDKRPTVWLRCCHPSVCRPGAPTWWKALNSCDDTAQQNKTREKPMSAKQANEQNGFQISQCILNLNYLSI